MAQLGLQACLRHNGRLVYAVSAGMGLVDSIGRLFGTEPANSLHTVQA